jgi:6-phosphogluconolactonase
VSRFELITFADTRLLASEVAARWIDWLEERQGDRPIHVALSGGRVTSRFFAEIARQLGSATSLIQPVHFFWADERCVPPEFPDSNYRVAREELFLPLKTRDTMIHRVPGELPPAEGAAKAEAELRRVVAANTSEQPSLDLVFLGMGEDGHVASLFPGQAESAKQARQIYRAVTGPKPPPNRVTLSYAAIAAAREVWVLASGEGKQPALRESLKENGGTPLARVLQGRAATRVFADVAL